MRINAQERQADALAADQASGGRALTGELQGVIDGLPAVGKEAVSEALRAIVKRVRNSTTFVPASCSALKVFGLSGLLTRNPVSRLG